MGRYSMDNPDPGRHVPAGFDWNWEGGTSVEAGRDDQLVVVTLGDWLRLVSLVGRRGEELVARVKERSAGLRSCAECGSVEVRRYRAFAAGPYVAFCASCWERLSGEHVGD